MQLVTCLALICLTDFQHDQCHRVEGPIKAALVFIKTLYDSRKISITVVVGRSVHLAKSESRCLESLEQQVGALSLSVP